jgi:hypothetical protein
MVPVLTSDPMAASPPPADQPAATGGAFSMDQFCEYAGIGKTKAYAEAKSDRLELRKIGSKTVVFRSEAERWLRSLPTATEINAKSAKPRRSTSDVATNPPARAGSNVRHQGADLDAETA